MVKTTQESASEIAKYFKTFPVVGGITHLVDIEVTVSLGAYTGGDVIDVLKTVTGAIRNAAAPGGGSGIIQSVQVTCGDAITPDVKVYFFTNSDLTIAADNAAWAPTLSDVEKLIPLVDDAGSVNLTTWETVGTERVSAKMNIGAPYRVASGEEAIYMLLVAGGANTFLTTDALHVRVGLLLD